jgi:hypothetical protein
MNKITDFPERVRERILKKMAEDATKGLGRLHYRLIKEVIDESVEKGIKSKSSNKTANVEHSVGYGSLDTPKGDKADTYYRIGVFCVRKRLADYDGISAKGTIDALTHCGVWPDDNPKYIDQSPVFRQIKAGKDRSERTKIVVWKWSEA